jgi:nucleotide-binding universal stress UspA family protein
MTKRDFKTPNETETLSSVQWKRILVPIDFSKSSLRALQTAVPLASDFGARIVLLFAVEPAGYLSGIESLPTAVPDSVIIKEAKENLPRIAKRFIPAKSPVTTLVGRGRPSDVITRAVRQQKIDLIVLATHGRTGLDHFLMGSTAEQVVRRARCPVLVVRTSVSHKKNH